MFLFCFLQLELNFLVLSISTHCRSAPCSSIWMQLGDATWVIVSKVTFLHLGLTQYLIYTSNIICYNSSETVLGGKALDTESEPCTILLVQLELGFWMAVEK